MKFYAIRHPETEWNVEGRFQGRQEGAITKIGWKQIKDAQKSTKKLTIDSIFHAPNNRTKTLAHQIENTYTKELEIIEDSRLHERSMGVYEGLLTSQMSNKDKESYDPTNYEQRFLWKPSKGESHKEVSERVALFIEMLQQKYSKDTALVVTSKGIIKIMYYVLNKVDLPQMYSMKIDNGSLHEFVFDEE